MKRTCLVLTLLVMMLSLNLTSNVLADEITGELTNISITIKDSSGKSHTLEVKDSKALKKVKVGDMVEAYLKNGWADKVEKHEEKKEAPLAY